MIMDSAPSLTVLDPGLFFEGGHHASLARVLVAQAVRAGLDCGVWGLKHIHNPPEGFNIHRRFTHSAYAPVDGADPGAHLRRYNDAMLADLRAGDGEIGAGVVFFPTITSRIALGAAEWIAGSCSHHDRRYALMLMFPPGFGGVLDEAESEIYREAMAILRTVPRVRLRIFAETPHIARVFESLGAPCVSTLPWPVTVQPGDTGVNVNHNPVIGHIGYSKIESGFGLLPDVVRSISGFHPLAKFVVQSNSWKDQAVDRCTERLETMSSVELLRGPLPPARYASVLNSIDIVLLPYNPDAYRERGSGVFVEAASCGRVLVVPGQTWLAEQAARSGLGAVSFASFTVESVVEAVESAIARFGELRETAQRSAAAWNAERDPAKFLNTVMGAFAGSCPAIGGGVG